jgi:RHS repeat-associated protein
MRYAAVAKFKRDQSLHAMWQAFRVRSFADQQLVENDAGVVRDLLNARYYDSSRGQFTSQDPVFWGDPKKQDLINPQDLNSYSYSADNPITRSDPNGLWYREVLTGQQSWHSFYSEVGEAANYLGQSSAGWNFAMSHPYTTGAFVGVGSYPALVSGGEAIAAARMATWPGVSAAFAAKQGFAALVYGGLTLDTTLGIPGFVGTLSQFSPSQPSTAFSAAWALTTGPITAGVGGYPGAFADAYQFAGLLNKTLGTAAINLFSGSIQARTSAVSSFNAAIGGTGGTSGGSGGGGGGGVSQPSNNSLWVTPSGAVVNWGGQLVSPPPSK